MDKDPNVKLYICCHQVSEVPEHPFLVPLQVGSALSDTRFPGFLQDDTGDNISVKNRSYCELTAQYWAWKNAEADYYGFFHYRRYLYPHIDAKRPYRVEYCPTRVLLDKLGYDRFPALIQNYDVILPKGEDMHIPVREHYAKAPFHHAHDLALIEEIIRYRYPAYAKAMEQYLSHTVCCFGNIYIMKRERFYDYCTWLFSILEEFDRQAQSKAYTAQEQRVDGYLAERLLGIYAVKMRENPSARVLELPRVHFTNSRARMWEKRAVNQILPPGSCRRAVVKKILR